MLKKVLTLSTAVAMFFAAHSQDSTKGTTTFTTSVDAYYRYDFNNAPGTTTNNITSFTNSKNSFELGMASVKIDHTIGKVAATVDLGFGRRASEFSYNDGTNSIAAVKQAYLSYAPSSKLKFTAGKWATHVGWELVDAYANRNYSMSYGFSEGPFFHTGLKADISLGGKSALMVGIANPTDFSTTTSQNKMAIAQFSTGTKNDKVKAYLNYQGGTDQAGSKLNQVDLVLNFLLSSKFGIVYDGTVQGIKYMSGAKSTWSSNALYLNYDPTSMFGLTLRGEYYNDQDGAKVSYTDPVTTITTWPKSIFATTLSGNLKFANLTIIPELRLDNSKEDYFAKKDGAATKSAASFILAATYKF
ncbi:outer membrane beta-barrel protein [Parasediminibacterium sp. JCM 36343]|uniref:outer membrane beta-barrel protein n=1 Tax=Parasediminibacterium sp. JCM 36343 TaxID=3374279 RepID=UPI00397BE272